MLSERTQGYQVLVANAGTCFLGLVPPGGARCRLHLDGASRGVDDPPQSAICTHVVAAARALSGQVSEHPEVEQPAQLFSHVALRESRAFDSLPLVEDRFVSAGNPHSEDETRRSPEELTSYVSEAFLHGDPNKCPSQYLESSYQFIVDSGGVA